MTDLKKSGMIGVCSCVPHPLSCLIDVDWMLCQWIEPASCCHNKSQTMFCSTAQAPIAGVKLISL